MWEWRSITEVAVGYGCEPGGCRVRTALEQAFPRPSVLGVVNVTPDSFFDGGAFLTPADAVARARQLLVEGAAIIDVGGESTRPGSAGVTLDEELRRVEPVLAALVGIPVSIDTSKAEVARRALALGAVMVNDVTALRADAELAGVVADGDAYLCLMHMRGEPRTMQDDPRYDDVVDEVKAFLEERLRFAVAAGVPEERICLDAGIGFGKTVEHNLELLARLDELAALGRPVLVGASRKRFLGRILGDEEALTGPLPASVAVAVLAYERGASLFRVHDVREHVEALGAARALVEAGP
jgi:dihydropteroate synthase